MMRLAFISHFAVRVFIAPVLAGVGGNLNRLFCSFDTRRFHIGRM